MHIPDGIIDSPLVLGGGYGLTGGITWYSLKQINKLPNPQAKVPKAALLTAAFFVINLIHIPVPPTSIHLILYGMMGAILGYFAVPAVVIALFFQAVMFQHGGITTLGVNAVIVIFPALLSYYIFELRHRFKRNQERWTKVLAFVAGATGIAGSALLFAVIVITNIGADIDAARERQAVVITMIAYIIPTLIEGTFTMMLASFLERVKPELLESKYEIRT